MLHSNVGRSTARSELNTPDKMKMKLLLQAIDLPPAEADHCEVRQSTQTLVITAEDIKDLTILEPLTLNLNPES